MNETYRFESFTMRKLQIKKLCSTSDTNLTRHFKAEIKVTFSEAYEYTTSVTLLTSLCTCPASDF